MPKQRVRAPSFRHAYTEAGDVLSKNGRRLVLIEAWMISLILLPLYVLTYMTLDLILCVPFLESPSWLLLYQGDLYGMLAGAITLFLTVPLLLGIFLMASRAERGEDIALFELFAPFSTRAAYRRCLGLSFGFCWRVGLLVWTVSLTYRITEALFSGSVPAGVICALLILCEITVGLSLLLRSFFVLFAATQKPMCACSDPRAEGFRMGRTCYAGGTVFTICMVPRLLLGLLTVGILLLADTLPRMCVAYFRYCRYINERMIPLEEDRS